MRRGAARIAAGLAAIFLVLGALPPAAAARDAKLVLKKEFGDVRASCIRLAGGRQELICVVVYAKPPYLGFQFGAPDHPDSVAVTAGARRVPNSEIEIKIDGHASHGVYGDGFIGTEAEAILGEVENGDSATVSFQAEGVDKPTEGKIDLGDLKTAIKEVQSLRDLQENK